MRTFALLAYVLVFAGSANAQTPGTDKIIARNLEQFKHDVAAARERAGVTNEVNIIPVKPQKPIASFAAWVQPYRLFGDRVTYGVYVREPFLEDATEPILEHVAMHEMCHLRNKDLDRPKLERLQNVTAIEAAAERCVIELVGKEHYRWYLEAFDKWEPKNPNQQLLRLIMKFNLSLALQGTPQ